MAQILPLLASLVIIFGFSCCYAATPSELNAVVVVFRHGDRTPVRPYPTDPYGNRSLWPADFGMLTNIGKRQHYELGQFFRQRYSTFLPMEYSEKDIYVRSTDVDRTLMSAEADVAGLYPPLKNDIWDIDVKWQPIPIHTIPEKMDAVLASKKPCDKYDYLLRQLLKTDYFKNISHTNHDLYAYLTRYSGETISDLKHMEYLYSTFQIETWYNFTIPEWAQKVFPQKLQPWAFLSFATSTFTTDLARLKTGPFFDQLLTYFKNRTETEASEYRAPKFLMFSAHDTTIANLLNTMGAFDYHAPPYTATIIFELGKASDGTNFVNTFYKNTSEVRPFRVKDCDIDCNLTEFKRVLQPVTLNLIDWESECKSMSLFREWSLNFVFLLSGIVLGLMSIMFLLFLAIVRARRKESNSYTQLPNEEYA